MKAFIIYLPDREHSCKHSAYMLETLKGYGLDAALFAGTSGDYAPQRTKAESRKLYPYSIKQHELSLRDLEEFIRPEKKQEFFSSDYLIRVIKKQRIGSDTDKLSLPGVQGCFYSHYDLWQRCVTLNQSIMIFEDDVKFFNSWIPVRWEDVLVLSLGKSSFLNEPYKSYLQDPSGNPQPMPFKQFSMPGASGYAIHPHAAKVLIKKYRNYFYPADNAINQSLVKIQIHNYVMGRNMLKSEGNISMTRYHDYSYRDDSTVDDQEFQ